MSDNQDNIERLYQELGRLLERQNAFQKEINQLRDQINQLNAAERQKAHTVEKIPEKAVPALEIEAENKEMEPIVKQPIPEVKKVAKPPSNTFIGTPKIKSDLEKFIGENLINKIGIIITIIGVVIGTRYAINHQLISPLTRIILGYILGAGLLGVSLKLKLKYENFSAVLLSGSMAILYFITFSAFSFYNLIPQTIAFLLMLIFTAFTVLASLKYNRQIIAHIGLVGAYAIPFLLSNKSGKIEILFSYVAIINIGILVIAFKKYWKLLYYAAFGMTWLIYFSWYLFSYEQNLHFTLALVFLGVFFSIFYLTFLAYKILQKEKFKSNDIVLLLANSFIFYGLGYSFLNGHSTGSHLLGLFTLGNAIVHFIVTVFIFRQKLADKNLFYFTSGLVLVFITIAIPVQLDGNWVTLLWLGEAVLLFWIGRTKNVAVYEKLSYPLMALAFMSLLQDWESGYGHYYRDLPETKIIPIFNIYFLTSVLFITGFSGIYRINSNKKYLNENLSKNRLSQLVAIVIPAILLVTTYLAFRVEIANYWDQLYIGSEITVKSEEAGFPDYYTNYDLYRDKTVWIINYTLLFLSILAFINLKRIKSQLLGIINLIFLVLTILVFLTQGLYELSELRESYLQQTLAEYYNRSSFNIGMRYISFGFVALALSTCYYYLKQDFIKYRLELAFDLLLHVTILWIASSELIHWMDMAGSDQSYKYGLSILWGSYALLLIALGIWKKKKHLRIGAITLFGVTLIKLFFYDIIHLNTIAKTIVFVSLGLLLLIISFLYHKYKHIISDETNS